MVEKYFWLEQKISRSKVDGVIVADLAFVFRFQLFAAWTDQNACISIIMELLFCKEPILDGRAAKRLWNIRRDTSGLTIFDVFDLVIIPVSNDIDMINAQVLPRVVKCSWPLFNVFSRVPLTAIRSRPNRSRLGQRTTNSWKTCRKAVLFSRRKSAMALKSGCNCRISQITVCFCFQTPTGANLVQVP